MVEQSKPRCERIAAMVGRRTWVNIAVCPCLHSFLTHNKHHLFENKVWEIYIKKCIRSLLKSSLSVDYVPVYICIRVLCNTRWLPEFQHIFIAPMKSRNYVMDYNYTYAFILLPTVYFVGWLILRYANTSGVILSRGKLFGLDFVW